VVVGVQLDNKLRIVSDGTIEGTKVLDSNGGIVSGIAKVEWKCDAQTRMPLATITFIEVPIELEVDIKNCELKELKPKPTKKPSGGTERTYP